MVSLFVWQLSADSNILSFDQRDLEKRRGTYKFLVKSILYYYTLQKKYLTVLPPVGNVPEVNFANKFSKHQNFTVAPGYLFKRTLKLKSEN